MNTRLYEAALTGSVDSLNIFLQRDPDILITAAVDGQDNPLHIASAYGHLDVVRHLLSRPEGPELAGKLNSQRSSPLHLASSKGYLEIVQELLRINSDMCLVRDIEGKTPLHAAALKGRVEVVVELVTKKPIATRVLIDQREPILHFCMNHNRFEVVKALLESVRDRNLDGYFMQLKNENDNTILHLAVAKKHKPMVEHLVTRAQELVNAQNIDGLTALDVLLQKPYEPDDEEILAILRRNQAKRGNEAHPARQQQESYGKWLENARGSLMIVAILIATVAFQAALNPPGGVYQETTYGDPNEKHWHFVGEAVLSYRASLRYTVFVIFNGGGFVASLLIILLLISELPLQKKYIMRILIVIMWIAVSTMLISYIYMSSALTSKVVKQKVHQWLNVRVSQGIWMAIFGLLFAANVVRWTSWYLWRRGILRMERHSAATWRETRPRLILGQFAML